MTQALFTNFYCRRISLDILNSMKAQIAFVFPGQGSQYVGMGKQLYEASPAARRIFDKADAILGLPDDGRPPALSKT